MSALRSSRFWRPTLASFLAGLLLLALTSLVRDEGRLLDFCRCLHYPSNQFMLEWDQVMPIQTYWGSILIEHTAFVAQWVLLGACAGWIHVRILHGQTNG